MRFGFGLGISFGSGVSAPKVAPEFVGYAIDTSTSGAVRTPNGDVIPLLKYDVLIHVGQNRGTGTTATETVPSGQGWLAISELNNVATGISEQWHWKRWGLGDTDDRTPSFTWSTSGSVNSDAVLVFRGCKRTGNPYMVTPVSLQHAAATTVTSAVAVDPGGYDWSKSLTLWGFQSIDDNTLANNSRGSLIFSNNLATFAAMAMVYEVGVNSSVAQCSMDETTQGTDACRIMTLVLEGDTDVGRSFDYTLLSTAAFSRSRINDTGWRNGVHTDPIVRSGFIYRYAVCVEDVRKIRLTCWRRAVGSDTWALVATHLTASIADPAGISNWPSDSHFTPTVGTSKSGKPQVWFLGHATESALQFWQGTGVGDVVCDTFATWTTPVEGSYPQQMNTADGTSLFSCRIGSAGNDAQQCLFEQNADEVGWTQITDAIMNFTNGGDDESPYMQRMVLDPATDRLKVSWCWAKANVTHEYHGVCYIEGRRTGVATWTWHDVSGGSVTLPALDTTTACQVATTAVPINSGLVVHSGMSFDSANGRPLIAILKAKAGNVHGNGSEHYLFEWAGSGTGTSAWNQRDVGEAHATWDFVDAPPNPEYAQARSPDVFVRNGVTYYTWTSNQDLSSAGLPCLMYRASTDRVTWSAKARLVDMPWGDGVGRYDHVGLHVYGKLTFFQQLIDENVSFSNPLITYATVVDVSL